MNYRNVVVVVMLVLWTCLVEGQNCSFHLVSLQYPKLALFAQIQGDVIVAIDVDSAGRVLSATSSAGHQILKEAAEENVRTWRFEPGNPRQLKIIYRFTLRDPAVNNPRTEWRVDFPDKVEVISDRQAPLG